MVPCTFPTRYGHTKLSALSKKKRTKNKETRNFLSGWLTEKESRLSSLPARFGLNGRGGGEVRLPLLVSISGLWHDNGLREAAAVVAHSIGQDHRARSR